ncbi:MAG: M48 family metalloprotease [Dehalococcoidia bacterium]|nr:M48 family metalloprotease [Dehalococcoidia bacterium]
MSAPEQHTGLDPARQRKARAYGKASRLFFFLDLALAFAYLVAAVALNVGGALRDQVPAPAPILAALALAVLIVVYDAVTLPLRVYVDYLLPLRYGLLTQSFSGWLLDMAKRAGLTLLLGGALLGVLYVLLELAPGYWWLLATLAFVLVSICMAVLLPLVIVPLFYKQKPLEDGELRTRLERMAERAKARVAGVFTIDVSAKGTVANAALMGMGRTRRIVLTDTMLQTYTADEIEAVMAHEMGHHALGHIPWGIAAQGALVVAQLYAAHVVAARLFPAFGYRDLSDVAGLPVLLLVLAVAGALGVPVTSLLSRRFERAADRFALEQTRAPIPFMSAMTRLTDQNLSESDPPRWLHLLIGSHPTYRERVRMAEACAPEDAGAAARAHGEVPPVKV